MSDFQVNRGEETDFYTKVNKKNVFFFNNWINLITKINPFIDEKNISINQNELVTELKKKYFNEITFGKWLKEGEKIVFLNLTKEHLDFIYFKPKNKLKISFGASGKSSRNRTILGHYELDTNLINLSNKRRPDKIGILLKKFKTTEKIFDVYFNLIIEKSGNGSLYHELGHYLDLNEYKFSFKNKNIFKEYQNYLNQNYVNEYINILDKEKKFSEKHKKRISKSLKSTLKYLSMPEEITARCFEILLKDLYLKNKKIDIKKSNKIHSGSNYDILILKENDDTYNKLKKMQQKFIYFDLKNFKFFDYIKNNL